MDPTNMDRQQLVALIMEVASKDPAFVLQQMMYVMIDGMIDSINGQADRAGAPPGKPSERVAWMADRLAEMQEAARWRAPGEERWDLRSSEIRLKASPLIPIIAKRSISNDLGWMTLDGRMIRDADILGWRPLGPGPNR